MNKELLFSKMPELKNQSVKLHSISLQDGDQLFRIYSDKQIFKYCGIIEKNNKSTVLKMIPHFERDFNKELRIKWGIYDIDSDLLSGIIEVMDISSSVNSVTIGYYSHPDFWNKGMTKSAVSLLIEYLFKEIEVNRIAAYVMPENHNSKRVLNATGFTREGLIRQGHVWPGKGLVDLELYSILKSDYTKSSKIVKEAN